MATRFRDAIRQAAGCDEISCVASLAAEFHRIQGNPVATEMLARSLVDAVRQQRHGTTGVDHLMHEFSLSTKEGVALMCLAEALLRIPDTATVNHLIREKIGHGDWHAHLGGSPSLFVNAATWGLMLSGKLLSTQHHGMLASALGDALLKGGEPLIRKGIDLAMRLLGQQFVMGETIGAALTRSWDGEARGYRHSFDMLGEAALTATDCERYFHAYETAIHAIGQAAAGRGIKNGPGISLKLSALHPRYVRTQRMRVMAELGHRLKHLALLAKHYEIGLNIDAEEADRLELSLDLFSVLAADPQLAAWDGMGFVVQAYQKRAPFVIDLLVDLARRTQRRLMIRLVKGAYWDSEIKRAQVNGLGSYPVYTRKSHTDLSYLVCAGRLLGAPNEIYPQFATHNAQTLAAVFQMAGERGVTDYEFQCLHGMGETLYDQVIGPNRLDVPCRIYAPVGTHKTLLPYLVRRLLENGANTSFVSRLLAPAIAIDELIETPLRQVEREGGVAHPAIPLPRDLYRPGRINSAGIDLADESILAALNDELSALATRHWHARPLVAGSSVDECTAQAVLNPANHSDQVGTVSESSATQINCALNNAVACSISWHQTPLGERASILRRAADLLESNRTQLFSLCIREAGKTLGNAVAEVREAVDFCRYYAQQLLDGNFKNGDKAPGPVVCISPWNFPLAIFIGEVSAALAAGSPVLAKPAEQTPLIACLAVALLHQAGLPRAVLQFLPGAGETVGAALTGDNRVLGVIFTGSTEVAQLINQSIAKREDVRLIAETGGQNAMIVDSSALPEQVVQDVISSGFDSAGQRCSALRVLCLQNEISETVLSMLKAAMQELSIADPARLSSDIGPLIDQEARARLLAHIESMRQRGRPIFQLSLPSECAAGCFFPPTLIEIDSLAELQAEVFGPVVHVLRYSAPQLALLIEAINATGYGLTLGLHSRIDETREQVTKRARIGNIYVNRNMVGAVVGVQPFGGEGLSGTGPKAGGALYLHRLADSEQVSPEDIGCRPDATRLEPDSSFSHLIAWAATLGQNDLSNWCRSYRRLTLAQSSIDLPGPTGEHNTLSFAPRGRMLCLAADESESLHQLAAVLATNNRVVMIDDEDKRGLLARLPQVLGKEIELLPAADFNGLAGVLFAGNLNKLSKLRQQLAATRGALIPLFQRGEQSALYPLQRMMVERVVSINTTAAGGNTLLITQGS